MVLTLPAGRKLWTPTTAGYRGQTVHTCMYHGDESAVVHNAESEMTLIDLELGKWYGI